MQYFLNGQRKSNKSNLYFKVADIEINYIYNLNKYKIICQLIKVMIKNYLNI